MTALCEVQILFHPEILYRHSDNSPRAATEESPTHPGKKIIALHVAPLTPSSIALVGPAIGRPGRLTACRQGLVIGDGFTACDIGKKALHHESPTSHFPRRHYFSRSTGGESLVDAPLRALILLYIQSVIHNRTPEHPQKWIL